MSLYNNFSELEIKEISPCVSEEQKKQNLISKIYTLIEQNDFESGIYFYLLIKIFY